MPLTSRMAPLYFSLVAVGLVISSEDRRAADMGITLSSRALTSGSTVSILAGSGLPVFVPIWMPALAAGGTPLVAGAGEGFVVVLGPAVATFVGAGAPLFLVPPL